MDHIDLRNNSKCTEYIITEQDVPCFRLMTLPKAKWLINDYNELFTGT